MIKNIKKGKCGDGKISSVMKNANKYQKVLEAEKVKLLKELGTVGEKSKKIPGEWEAKPTDLDADSADENEVADEVEEFENNSGILEKLEVQLKEVDNALTRIKTDTYGICSVCGTEILEARLKANPAASTCVKHSK